MGWEVGGVGGVVAVEPVGMDTGQVPQEMCWPGLESLFDNAERSLRLWHNYRFMKKL